jgi:protein-S-isoprenylcysteine O-methyltransferase
MSSFDSTDTELHFRPVNGTQNQRLPPWAAPNPGRHVGPSSFLLRQLSPGEPKSLAGIAMRAFCLGLAGASSAIATLGILFLTDSPGWRVPSFILALSVFHFLEFWTTAKENTLVAGVDSFLLTSNWPWYAVAHSAAALECTVVSLLFPRRSWAPFGLETALLAVGLTAVIAGQVVRSLAMLHAGQSFNHQIQTHKAASHKLVTDGVYGYFRHPSYFGFFYWGLGTQLVMGNVICFFAYSAVLWFFFSERIKKEEEKLVEFFKEDYVNYRARVGTKLPFIP